MAARKQLTLATRNRHKVEEVRAMLGDRFEVRDLSAVPEAPEIEETGATFSENAALKAVGISRVVGGLVLADDSGLEVDALGGAPGVYSARFAGRQGDDAANIARVLRDLEGVAGEARTGRFRCALVLAQDGVMLAGFQGTVEGCLVGAPRGTAGFGYDPLFVPEGFAETFAELGAAVKNRLSHRARALEGMAGWLLEREGLRRNGSTPEGI